MLILVSGPWAIRVRALDGLGPIRKPGFSPTRCPGWLARIVLEPRLGRGRDLDLDPKHTLSPAVEAPPVGVGSSLAGAGVVLVQVGTPSGRAGVGLCKT